LRALQVRVAGHDDIEMCLGFLDQGVLQGVAAPYYFEQVVANKEVKIEGYLVVSTARCVEFSRHRADQLRQVALYVHVDVFVFGAEFEFVSLEAL
jgi:hypothetical protein